MAEIDQLQYELAILEQRLREGERRIEEAARIGTDTETWESFWIDLLHRYEGTVRQLTARHATQSPPELEAESS